MIWIQLVFSALSALAGGFIGGWTVAYRLGSWRQRVEDRLSHAERRLEKGDKPIERMPVLAARIDVLIEEVKGIKAELRQERSLFVTKELCDRRHDG